jgi:hypothetical protein
MTTTAQKTDTEVLTPLQRWGELVLIAVMLLLLGFFAYHQWARTGFFTARFGPREMLCLYGPILLSFAAPIVRLLAGRRNPARPLDAATSLFLATADVWLLTVFPFDFSHLTDILPGVLRYIFSWMTDDIGRAILILQIVVSLISALVTMIQYLSVRRRERATPSPQ